MVASISSHTANRLLKVHLVIRLLLYFAKAKVFQNFELYSLTSQLFFQFLKTWTRRWKQCFLAPDFW